MPQFYCLRRLTVLLSVSACLIFSPSWAQEHQHTHQPLPQGAAHEHHFNDIKKAVKMFEDPTRNAWQKPEDVVKQGQSAGTLFGHE